MEALPLLFMTYAYFFSLPSGPSSPNPNLDRQKNSRKRGLSVWTQIGSVFNGKNTKRKPLTNTSQVTFTITLKIIISTKKNGASRSKHGPHVQMHDMIPRVKFRPKWSSVKCSLNVVVRPRNRHLSVCLRAVELRFFGAGSCRAA